MLKRFTYAKLAKVFQIKCACSDRPKAESFYLED